MISAHTTIVTAAKIMPIQSLFCEIQFTFRHSTPQEPFPIWLASRDVEIEHLRLLIAKLRHQQFGRLSEKREHPIEQLELQLEELEARRTKETAKVKEPGPASTAAARPVRRALPDRFRCPAMGAGSC